MIKLKSITSNFFNRVINARIVYVFVIVILLSSCFANQNRVQRYSKVEQTLKQGNISASLEIVKNSNAYSNRDQLVYMMDNGVLNLYNDQEDLYTQSVSANISTYFINDNQRPYTGEDYEVLYLNILKSLAFIADNNSESAMVEIKRGIDKLNIFEIRYQKQLDKLKSSTPEEFTNTKDNSKGYDSNLGKYDFADSVLLRLLSLILHRNENQDDEALIDKRKIEEIWKLYPNIYNFRKIDLNNIQYIKPKDKVLLNIVAFSGMTAKKSPWDLDVVTTRGVMNIRSNTPGKSYSTFMPFGGGVGSFSISIPYIERRNNRINKAVLYIDGEQKTQLDLVERTSNIAINQFEKQKSFIVMKSLIRATAKAVATYQLQEEARKKRAKGEDDSTMVIAGLFSSVFASATEVADIRSWNTLPDNCYFGEIALPEGEYNIEIHYLDANNNTVNVFSKRVNLNKRKKNNLIMSYAL